MLFVHPGGLAPCYAVRLSTWGGDIITAPLGSGKGKTLTNRTGSKQGLVHSRQGEDEDLHQLLLLFSYRFVRYRFSL